MVNKTSLSKKLISVLLCICIVITPGFSRQNRSHAISSVATLMACGTTLGPAASVIAAILVGSGIGVLLGSHVDTLVSFWNTLTASEQAELTSAGEAAAATATVTGGTYQYAPSADMVSALSAWVATHASSVTSVSSRKDGYISPSEDSWTTGTVRSQSGSYIVSAPVKLADDLFFQLVVRNVSYMMAVYASYSIDGINFSSAGGFTALGAYKKPDGTSASGSTPSQWSPLFQDCAVTLVPNTALGYFTVKVTSPTGSTATFLDRIYLGSAEASLTAPTDTTNGIIRSTAINADLIPSSESSISLPVNPTYLPTGTFTGTPLEESYNDYIANSSTGIALPLAPDYPLDIPVPGDYDYSDEEEYVDDLIHIGTNIRDYTYSPDSDVPIARPSDDSGSISLDWPQDIPVDDSIDDTAGGEGASENLPWIFRIPILGQILKALKALWDLLLAGFNKILDLIKSLISTVSTALDSFWKRFSNFWKDIPNVIKEILNTLRQILDYLSGFILNLGSYLTGILSFITGYTLFQNLFTHFLPAPVATVMWAMWLCAMAIWLLRMLLDR